MKCARLLRLLLCFLWIGSSLSAEESKHLLKRNDRFDGNYYASDQSIEISGVIDGDAYLAGAQILVDGEILGDLICAGGSVTITGKVHGNVRVASGQVVFNGLVGRNLSVATGNYEGLSEARVMRDALIIAANAESHGTINGSARFYVSNMRFGGSVRKDLSVYAGTLNLKSSATVDGNLVFSSESKASISPRANIGGKIEERTSQLRGFFENTVARTWIIGTHLATTIMNFLFSWVIGAFLLHFFPTKVFLATNALRTYPIRCFGTGILFLLILPVIFFVLIFSVLGLPFALLLLAINIFGFFTVKNLVIISFSSLLLPRFFKKRPYSLFFLGLITYFILKEIPYAGGLLSIVVTTIGIGAVLIGNTPKVRRLIT